MNAAHALGGQNTITLAPGARFTLTAADNWTDGATGLPVVAVGNNLTIIGNGDIIERGGASGTPDFRLLDVAAGAALRLTHLTVQGGRATDNPLFGAAAGGAVFNRGALTLDGVTVQNNVAVGQPGSDAIGGGIWSDGALTLTANTVVRNNQALGGGAAFLDPRIGSFAGGGFGGGLFVGGGTAVLTGVTLSGNVAQGGRGGDGFTYFDEWSGTIAVVPPSPGGVGYGGGLFVNTGAVELHGVTVTGNAARGGAAGHGKPHANPGPGVGGGLYFGTLAVVCLDGFTQAHVMQNKASTSNPNINGPWTPC